MIINTLQVSSFTCPEVKQQLITACSSQNSCWRREILLLQLCAIRRLQNYRSSSQATPSASQRGWTLVIYQAFKNGRPNSPKSTLLLMCVSISMLTTPNCSHCCKCLHFLSSSVFEVRTVLHVIA
jgi:hypothetical protein